MNLEEAMRLATEEIVSNDLALVYGGHRPTPRRPVDGYDINCGCCEDWAERVAELTGGVEVLEPFNLTGDPEHEMMGHIFIRHGGKLYDAECLTGVDRWEDLPLFINNRRLEEEHENRAPAKYLSPASVSGEESSLLL